MIIKNFREKKTKNQFINSIISHVIKNQIVWKNKGKKNDQNHLNYSAKRKEQFSRNFFKKWWCLFAKLSIVFPFSFYIFEFWIYFWFVWLCFISTFIFILFLNIFSFVLQNFDFVPPKRWIFFWLLENGWFSHFQF